MKKKAKAQMTRAEIEKLSDADLTLMLARESLLRYGTPIPPPVETREHVRKANKPSKEFEKQTHKCPHCGHIKNVAREFGTRFVRGVERKQSWCMECRAKTNYYDKPRRNRH